MTESRITYTPRSGVTSKDELSTLVAVYKLLVEKKEAASAKSRPNNAEERSENAFNARTSIQR